MFSEQSSVNSYKGIRVTILGLGTFGGGAAAARFLAERGAAVTLTDLRNEEQLQQALAEVDDVSFEAVHLGGHPYEAFERADMIVVNPAVKPDSDVIQRCRDSGAAIISEIELFLKHNAASVVAVTGSNGKSTTAALTQQLLASHLKERGSNAWLGGNIGNSLLPCVAEIHKNDVVVLELSSFQLHYLASTKFSPRVAVVTNFAANHLDWHPSLDHYRISKQQILRHQTREDFAILPNDLEDNEIDGGMSLSPWRVRGQRLQFGGSDQGEDGAFWEDGSLILRRGRFEDAVRMDAPATLPGVHNRHNITAAACAAWCLGADPAEFANVLTNYKGLPHRLQLVAPVVSDEVSNDRGIRFYNDSLATTPESAVAALTSFSQPCVIIAGGSDKGVDLSAMAETIHQRACGAVLIGATAHELQRQLEGLSSSQQGPVVRIADDFENAFSLAVEVAPQGSIVLLSPGCASYGWFKDFRERGERFTQLAQQWLQK